MNLSKKELKFKTDYDELAQPLFRFIYFKTKDKQLAQDIVQDSFVKYWDKIETVGDGKQKSYLFTTAKNLLLNNIQHNKVVEKYEASYTTSTKSTSPLFELEVSEFKKELESAIAGLPDKQREVFLMHRIEGFKYKEISVILELSQKAVEKRMSQALIVLRKVCIKI
jgi:RNA polymerase sigma-70 factor (ECF subfamily)